MSKEQFLQKLNKLKIKAVDYFHLLFKSAHYNYYRIETIKKDATGKIHCDVTFDSYAALRQFQDKLRKISLGVGTIVTTTVVAALIINLATGPVLSSFAAAYDFTQADWSGGESAELAYHATNQNDWNKYSSKDANVSASSTISLATTTGAIMQTDDGVTNTGFNLSGSSFVQAQVTGASTTAAVTLATLPASIDTAEIAGGDNHSLTLKTDGTVWAWGYNNAGQLGDGTTVQKLVPTQVKGVGGVGYITNISQIAAGSSHSVAIKTDGTLWAWGANNNGQLGDGTVTLRNTPVQVKDVGGVGYISGVVQVVAGYDYTVAVKADGTVWAWGLNNQGQLGNGTTVSTSTPVQVKDVGGVGYLAGVTVVSIDFYHSLALKTDGTVWAWGLGSNGQLGNNTTVSTTTPVQVKGVGGVGYLTDVSQITAGGNNSIALKTDGTVWAWGYNINGSLGDGTTVQRNAPVQVKGVDGVGYLTGVTKITADYNYAIALKGDGTVWAWGLNSSGQLGNGTTVSTSTPIQVKDVGGVGYLGGIVKIAINNNHSLALKSDGTITAWGYNSYGQLGIDSAGVNQLVPMQAQVRSATVSNFSDVNTLGIGRGSDFLSIKNDNTLWAWGLNSNGQLGDGTIINRSTPYQASLTGVSKIAGNSHTLALKTDGTVWAWGYNNYGQLGDNSTTQRNIPVQVKDVGGVGYLAGISQISNSDAHSLALKTDGTIWAWGLNYYGELGNGGFGSWAANATPIQVKGLDGVGYLTNVVKISAGAYHSLALKTDGTLWAWGSNSNGQLGNGTTTSTSTPIQIITNVVEISAGAFYSLALKTDGTLWAWGSNNFGQLGDNTTSDRNVPVQVKDVGGVDYLNNVSQISAGSSHSLALKTDGTVWAWGYNGGGALGDDTTSNRYTPVQVKDVGGVGYLNNVSQISANNGASYVLKTDGTLLAWGANSSWQLGDGTNIQRNTPVQTILYPLTNFNVFGAPSYYSTGTSTSGIIDLGHKTTAWGNLSWSASTTASTTLTMKARTCAASDCVGAAAWDTCVDVANGDALATGGCATAGDRYVQYQTVFSTTDIAVTPSLNDATIGYEYYTDTGSLISSAYNTQDGANALGKIIWTAGSLPAGTEIKFQMRTAPDSGGIPGAWTGWEGPDGTSNTYFIDSTGEEAMPANFQSDDNDQWFQYKSTLFSDGANTPVLSGVDVVYVVNASPTVADVIASQVSVNQTVATLQGDILAATGSVIVSAGVLDLDTDSGSYDGGSMRNKVVISMKYFNTDSQTWENVATSSIQGMPDDFIVDQISSSTLRNFSLIWNPNIEFDNQENSSDFKIQILADDKESANNIGASSSPVFALDTKMPIVDNLSTSHTAIKIDARQKEAMTEDEVKIIIQANDIADVRYRYSLSSTTIDGLLPNDGVNADSGEWILNSDIKIGTSAIIKVGDIDHAQVDTVYIQYKDGFDNLDPTVYEITIPAGINSIMIQDVTNTYVDPSDVKFFLSWRESSLPIGGADELGEFKAWYLERADSPGTEDFTPVDTDFNLISSSTDRTINYYYDDDIVENYHYYYRVLVEDGIGNFSHYTIKSDTGILLHAVPDGVQDYGEGGGGTAAGIPPVISSVEIFEALTTQAEIVWNTDILSNSSVEYISVIGTTTPTVEDFATAPFKGVATMLDNNEGLGKHHVIIDNLNSNTTYYFRVKSTSADGTEGTSFDETYHFATLNGPKIASSTIIVQSKTNNSLTITWDTDVESDSFVGYSIDYNMINPIPIETGQNDSVVNHSVTVNNLIQGTRYYFYVKSGAAKDNNLGEFYSDITTSDATAPNIAAVTSEAKRNTAVIVWQTNEAADSKILLGIATGTYDQVIDDGVFTNYHVISLSNLAAATKYYFKVVSSDSNGNAATSSEYIFTTEGISLTNVIASTTSESSVDITWNTDENTTSQVQYGTDLSTLLITGTLEPVLPSDSTKNHSITIDSLIKATKYYYRVISTLDGYVVSSPIYYFTSGDVSAPGIVNIQAINISTNAVTINWETDEAANSVVEWGTSTASYVASTSNDILTRTHSLNITGLNTYTDYYFRVKSSDGNSNATTSSEYVFKTANFKIFDVFASAASTTATISWETEEPASSQVEYSTDASFAVTVSYPPIPTEATTTHSVNLLGLSDGSVYYYKVRSIKDGYSQESPVYTFSTTDQTAPIIETTPQVSIITDTTAIIYWQTNETSDSFAYYGVTSGGPYASEYDNRLTTLHFLELSGLMANTTYYFYVASKDGGANLATSSEYSFTTLDAQAVHEELVNPGDPTVIKSDIEAIVTIPTTNTTATSKLCYSVSPGIDINNCTGQTILTPTRTHSYYLANLNASTTYYIKTKVADSEDETKNFISNEVSFQTLSVQYTSDLLAEKQQLIDDLEQQLADLQDKAYTEAEMQTKIAEINDLKAQLAAASSKGGNTLIIDKTDKTPPVIANVKIAEVGDVYAKITWSTNEEASSMIGYGTSIDYDSAESNYQSYLKRVKDHVIYLRKLSPKTSYHFSAVSADSWGNMISSPDFMLTTLDTEEEVKKDIAAEAKKETENTLSRIQEMINDLLSSGKVNPEDIRAAIQKTGEPPMITGAGPEVSNITSKSATITWKTNRKSNSIISYYIESMGRDTAEQVGNYSALVTDHTVNISNLSSGRKYVFVAQSVDALGNIGASDQQSFETSGIPFISEVSISNITNTSVEISWLSNTETTTELDYGSTVAYGQTAKSDSVNFVFSHSLRLSNLKSGQIYHFKAKGMSKKSDIISSDDYTFRTLTSFDVLTYSINKITDKSADIFWKTTNESTSEIEYTNVVSKVTDSIRTGEYTKDHNIKLNNLIPGTRYIFKIKGWDMHDQVVESKGFEFSTLIDTQAPIIEYVQADMALISKGDQDTVQAVVTWKTNEPSTSEIIYTEGGAKSLPILDSSKVVTDDDKKTTVKEININDDKFSVAKDNGSLTQRHVLVITDFKPSTVYTFKARSVDEAGNVSYSKDYTVLAPSKEESVLQIIIKTFEDTFGWLKVK